MGWRWGRVLRSAPLVVCFLLLGPAAWAVELRRLDTTRGSSETTVRLLLSAPAPVAVRGIPAGPGTVWRLYVDLPPGTSLGAGVRRVAHAAPPLSALRVGLGDGGVLRVVLELDEAVVYRVRRAADGRRVTLALGVAEPADDAPPAADVVPEPRQPLPVERASLRPKIVIDPGHGGRDPGAQGYGVEKEVTLAIARRLAAHLRDRLGAVAILTRSDDVTLPLAERTARANAEGADLFVSIHANASRSPRLHGVESYYLNNTHDRATIRLAAMENGLGEVPRAGARADLRYILSDLVQVGKMDESIALAGALQHAVVAQLRTRYANVTDLGVKQGPFYVLVGAYMPCVLVEASFLTHPTEGRRLAGTRYQEAVAEGLYAGIARFLADGRRARTL